jgi:hydrogenase-4 component E
MHATRKNMSLVDLYALQSFAFVLFLFVIGYNEGDWILLFVALLTLVIKAIVAPYFFTKLIKGSKIYFASGAHFGIPLSLIAIFILMFFSTKLLAPFLSVIDAEALLPLMLYPILMSGILVSLFFIVNRKDVLAQVMGILSLENWTMLTSVAIGVKHSLLLEIGMSFDIAVWIIIAFMFVTKLHQSFGNLHLSHLTQLKEE